MYSETGNFGMQDVSEVNRRRFLRSVGTASACGITGYGTAVSVAARTDNHHGSEKPVLDSEEGLVCGTNHTLTDPHANVSTVSSKDELTTQTHAKVTVHVYRLDNITFSQQRSREDAVEFRLEEHVEDGSGNYNCVLLHEGEVTEDELNAYNNEANPNHNQLLSDWSSWLTDNRTRNPWRVHLLVVDFFNMDHYDLGAGGVAYAGSAANSGGGVCWAYNERGSIHEVAHTLMDTSHWHHNMGVADSSSNSTAMGVQEGRGCGYSGQYVSPIGNNSTRLSDRTGNAIRKYRDYTKHLTNLDDCCYGGDDNPCAGEP